MALPRDILEQLVDHVKTRRPVAYVVPMAGGSGHLEPASDHAERFRADRSGVSDDGTQFIAVFNPPLRLAIIGAVHIAQALLPMARVAGFDPVVIDPRGALGSEALFPGETILDDWPDEALAAQQPDARTALVLLTHDPKLDDPALHIALKSDGFYIGALGSTRTHAKRVERLKEAGFTDADIARINGPVGLDIGAATPAEIAVSILAQMVQTLRGRA